MKIDLEKIKLQYISTGYKNDIKEVLEAGCRWIQIRIKNESPTIIEEIALKVQTWCKDYDATFIINDYVNLAKKIDADGVHLGKLDINVNDARSILGNKIVGGTANNLSDVLQLKDRVDYIGLGPYRWTQTKEKLSPIIGIEGYKKLLAELNVECHASKHMQAIKNATPIIAIGGITPEDVKELLAIGINGVAVSGSIYNSNNIQQSVNNFLYYL